MNPTLVVDPQPTGERKTIPAGSYNVKVRVGRGHEAPIKLVRFGMTGPTIYFRLNPDPVAALAEAIQQLAEREGK